MENAESQRQPKVETITFQGKSFRCRKKFSIALQ